MEDERFPDIEVYIKGVTIDDLRQWLHQTLQVTLRAEGNKRWCGNGVDLYGHPLPCMLLADAADGFASLSFDSNASPWPQDIDCARALHAALGGEVRCSPGSWQPGDEPERYIRLLAGQQSTLLWQ